MTFWPVPAAPSGSGGIQVYRSDIAATQSAVALVAGTLYSFPTPIKTDFALAEDGLVGVGFVGQMAGLFTSATGNATVTVAVDGVAIRLLTVGGIAVQTSLANNTVATFTTIRTSPTAGMTNGGALDVGPNVSQYPGLIALLLPAGPHTIEVMGTNSVNNGEAVIRNARLAVTAGSSVI